MSSSTESERNVYSKGMSCCCNFYASYSLRRYKIRGAGGGLKREERENERSGTHTMPRDGFLCQFSASFPRPGYSGKFCLWSHVLWTAVKRETATNNPKPWRQIQQLPKTQRGKNNLGGGWVGVRKVCRSEGAALGLLEICNRRKKYYNVILFAGRGGVAAFWRKFLGLFWVGQHEMHAV
jgi:hypothetical protein